MLKCRRLRLFALFLRISFQTCHAKALMTAQSGLALRARKPWRGAARSLRLVEHATVQRSSFRAQETAENVPCRCCASKKMDISLVCYITTVTFRESNKNLFDMDSRWFKVVFFLFCFYIFGSINQPFIHGFACMAIPRVVHQTAPSDPSRWDPRWFACQKTWSLEPLDGEAMVLTHGLTNCNWKVKITYNTLK